MRWPAVTTVVVMIGLISLSGSRQDDTCAVTIQLTDASTGRELSGLLKIVDAEGQRVRPPELLPRGLGIKEELAVGDASPIHDWSVLVKKTTISLPRKKLTIEAISGLETETGKTTIDLSGRTQAEVSIPLIRFHDTAADGARSGNTHLHLQKINRAEADRYLLEVPKGDDLDLVFLSYLERAGADRFYISNRYTDGDLASLSRRSETLFGNGEEHRHNLKGYGEGYGHVMLLNINKLILPVSIGPGIMKMGTDGLPLQRGIDTARRDGATIVWCHNDLGREAFANFISGRVDAQNIFDGGIRSSYKHSFYRYLNAGLRVPFSTGTDWFIYDFSRVYVTINKELSVENWLKGLAAGKSYITNGPLLSFSISGKQSGETIELDAPSTIRIECRAVGRVDFKRIELIQNGKVVSEVASRPVGGHYEAKLTFDLGIVTPCWLALRTPPQPIEGDARLSEPVAKNEFGRDLFAHTSPIYVEVAGRSHFKETVALELLDEMEQDRAFIAANANFADNQERQRVLDVYDDGIEALDRHIDRKLDE